MKALTVGSLCSGYGGLEMAMHLADWPVRLAWVADNDPGPAAVLAHHHPDVPNLGDISTVDWSEVEPVDILGAGFPCTDISCAGRQAGMGVGTRSGVWAHVVDGIAILRPRLVVIENVEALLSTRANRITDGADSDLGPGPAGVGDGPDRPALRALGAVLGDLCTLGFDAQWATVAASDVGACHRRRRVFILAWPQGTDPRALITGARGGCAVRSAGTDATHDVADSASLGHGNPRAACVGGIPATSVAGGAGADGLNLLPTPAGRLGDGRGQPNTATAARRMGEEGRRNLEDAVALLPTPASRDWKSGASNIMDRNARPLNEVITNLLPTPRTNDARGPGAHGDGGPDLRTTIALLPTPTATPYGNNQSQSAGAAVRPSLDSLAPNLLPTPTAKDADGSRNATANRCSPKPTTATTGWTLSDVTYAERWGQYAPAIARWETVLGRAAPDPTEPGAKGQPRLSPRFVEWMMGLDEGYVSDHLSRNAALRALGNGVVPLQAAHAFGLLLGAIRV